MPCLPHWVILGVKRRKKHEKMSCNPWSIASPWHNCTFVAFCRNICELIAKCTVGKMIEGTSSSDNCGRTVCFTSSLWVSEPRPVALAWGNFYWQTHILPEAYEVKIARRWVWHWCMYCFCFLTTLNCAQSLLQTELRNHSWWGSGNHIWYLGLNSGQLPAWQEPYPVFTFPRPQHC